MKSIKDRIYTKTKVSIVAFLLFCTFCGSTFIEDQTKLPERFFEAYPSPILEGNRTAGKRALLIGINDYQYVRKLHGCINDVKLMKSLLVSKYGFPEEQIVPLLNEKATRKAILRAFHDLIAATNTNDTVVIHYSGHGSQISNPKEIDGLDETIIPYDYRISVNGSLPITDKQISGLLFELSRKTSNITVILDCCHSGGATKDLLTGTEREIPQDPRMSPVEDDFLLAGTKSLPPLREDAAKYVLLAGCRSDQKSYETKTANGIYAGMLTFSLVNKLSSAKKSLTWPEVLEDLQAHIRQFYNQSPELAGLNKNSYVFGSTYVANEAYFTTHPGANSVILVENGGKAQNVTVGSTFKVYPPGNLDFTIKHIGLIQITKTFNFSSEAKVISGNATLPNSRIVEHNHSSSNDEKFLVGFLGNWNGTQFSQVKKKMVAHDNTIEDNKYPNIIYYRKSNEIVSYIGRDTTNALEKFPLNDAKIEGKLLSSVHRWDKWFRVANIKNPASQLKVTLMFEKPKDITPLSADINFKSGIKVSFNLKNASDIPIFVYVLNLTDDGDIAVYTLDSFAVPGQSISEAIPPGRSVECALTPTVRPGYSLTRDVLKIFFTSVASDFKSLQQDDSKAFEDVSSEKDLEPINKRLEKLDDWITIEKVIFVTL